MLFTDINTKYLDLLNENRFVFGLSRMKKISRALGIEKKFPVIHIAGTNGKGSTANYCAAILALSGYRTGLYTSPHLYAVTERISIREGKELHNIFEGELSKRIGALRRVCEKHTVRLTYFEFLTALALKYFLDSRIDALVLETGLGGRLDATNIFPDTDIAVITNIELEHTDWLGGTKKKIAFEKAGIIKKNSIVITGEKSGAAAEVIKNKCRAEKARLIIPEYKITQSRKCKVQSKTGGKGRYGFDIDTALCDNTQANIRKLVPGMRGKYQCQNAALAVSAALNLACKCPEMTIREKAIRQALRDTKVPGRFEEIKISGVRTLLDCAHNPAALQALLENISGAYDIRKTVLLAGFLADKDAESLLKIISAYPFKKIIITRPVSARAFSPSMLCRYPETNVPEMLLIEDFRLAREYALNSTVGGGVLLCAGSFYITGNVLK